MDEREGGSRGEARRVCGKELTDGMSRRRGSSFLRRSLSGSRGVGSGLSPGEKLREYVGDERN